MVFLWRRKRERKKTQFREREKTKKSEHFLVRERRVTGFCLLVGVARNPDKPKWTN